MQETVAINGITLCHKNSDGWVRSTLPDVCKSPSVPVPYTNVAFAKDLADGTTTVFSHGGAMNGVKGSRFAKSIGDEPGVGGGVISGVNLHEATWLMWSPNVFMEGRPVTRLTDKMLLNKGNTVSVGGYQTTYPKNSKEQAICEIACFCWVTWRGSSNAGPVMDMVPQVQRRYSTCFKKTANQFYPNTEVGKAGSPGLISEKGYWDPLNAANTTEAGKPPGMPIGKEAPWYSGDWFNVTGSRWLDAVWVDSSGTATDMWDIKFGDDRENSFEKSQAYRAIAKKHGAKFNGEFRVPSQCNDCADEEEAWRAEKLRQLNALGKGLSDAAKKMPLPIPGGRLPVPIP